MKKKLSLGDIIKKINEEQGNKADLENNTVHDNTSETGVPQSAQQSENRHEPVSDLPAQPSIGITSKRADLFFKGNPVPPKGHVEETRAFNAVSDIPPPPQTDRMEIIEEKPGVLPERFFDDAEEDEESFDVFKYVGIILRRKKVVLAVVLLMTVFSIFKYATGVKYYSAFSRLLFKPNNLEIMNSTSNVNTTGTYGNSFITHLELLKSHTVLSIVSQNLNNKISQEQIFAGLTIKQGETNGQKNDIIELSFKSTNAAMARDVLNELCKTYIEYRRDVNSQETTRLVYKFESQIN
jgi:capsular polysaccharide biosynthesis protein